MTAIDNHRLAYTIEETAQLLSLSRAHVYRLVEVEELKSVKIGRSRRITEAQLREFLARLEVQGKG